MHNIDLEMDWGWESIGVEMSVLVLALENEAGLWDVWVDLFLGNDAWEVWLAFLVSEVLL